MGYLARVVQIRTLPSGKPYYAACEFLDDAYTGPLYTGLTFSLFPPVWNEANLPSIGQIVLLNDLQENSGEIRALKASLVPENKNETGT